MAKFPKIAWTPAELRQMWSHGIRHRLVYAVGHVAGAGAYEVVCQAWWRPGMACIGEVGAPDPTDGFTALLELMQALGADTW